MKLTVVYPSLRHRRGLGTFTPRSLLLFVAARAAMYLLPSVPDLVICLQLSVFLEFYVELE